MNNGSHLVCFFHTKYRQYILLLEDTQPIEIKHTFLHVNSFSYFIGFVQRRNKDTV